MSYPPSASPYTDAAPKYPAAGPPAPTGSSGIAIAGLIVGIAAFVTGWVPFLGLILGAIGIVLGIIAVRKNTGRGLGIAALILSGLATLTNIIVIVILITTLPGALLSAAQRAQTKSDEANANYQAELDAQTEDEASAISGQGIVTPCYSFDGPSSFINNQSSASTEDCVTTLELWGQVLPDGTIVNTGVGSIMGQVNVEPVRVSTSETWTTTGDLDSIVNYMATDYLPQMGEVLSLREPIALDESPANVSRIESFVVTTKTKAIIVGFAPNSYNTSQGPVQLFVISVVTPFDNGDQLIDAVVNSWVWK